MESRGWTLGFQRSLPVFYSRQLLNNENSDPQTASELTAGLKLNLGDCIYQLQAK